MLAMLAWGLGALVGCIMFSCAKYWERSADEMRRRHRVHNDDVTIVLTESASARRRVRR